MPDQNGAPVVGPNGLIGTVLGPSTSSPSEVAIALDDGREISVLPSALSLQPGGTWYLSAEPPPGRTIPPAEDSGEIIPVISEELEVSKRKRVTGGVRVEKTSVAHHEAVSMPLTRESVDVRRVLIDRPVSGPVPVRREGDTVIMPVVEEVATVHKQLILKEEIHVTRRRSTEQYDETVQLNSEHAEIVRTDSQGRQVNSPEVIQPHAGGAEILPPEERSILDPTKPRPSFLGLRRRTPEPQRSTLLDGE